MNNFKNNNFWMIPKQIYSLDNLPAKAILLYGVIYSLANNQSDYRAFASVKEYSKFLNCSVQYVYKLLDTMAHYDIKLQKVLDVVPDYPLIDCTENDDYLLIEPKVSNRILIEKKTYNRKNQGFETILNCEIDYELL